MKKKTHNSLIESLQIILPIAKGAVNQLKMLAPREGTWIGDGHGGYEDEVQALETIEQYLKYLKTESNDIKIRIPKPKKKEWFGGDKTCPFPEDL